MRVLLMISNNNMSLRELYTAVLDNHRAGWASSFMSGMPSGVEGIISGYDAVIYELGPADSADRVAIVTSLRRAGAQVITHVEGRQAAERTQELQAAGALVVPNPISGARIGETLDALVQRMGKARKAPGASGLGSRLRRLFGN